MPSSFNYRPDIEKELARSDGLVVIVEEYVRAGANAAIDAAPYRAHAGGPHYRETIGSTVGVDRRGIVGSVLSTDPFAHLVEFGSINNVAYAPLRRGVEATGLKVTDRGRSGSSS